jgi:hypothetical protein
MSVQNTNNLPQNSGRHHALNIAQSLRQVAAHAAADVDKIEEESGREIIRQTAERLDQVAGDLEKYGYQD